MGTLDPLASGLLVLAIDRATKFSRYFLESDKSYDVKVSLGISTDTDDSTGNIISESNDCPDEGVKKKELYRFKGESFQVPPFFLHSNIKESLCTTMQEKESSFQNLQEKSKFQI